MDLPVIAVSGQSVRNSPPPTCAGALRSPPAPPADSEGSPRCLPSLGSPRPVAPPPPADPGVPDRSSRPVDPGAPVRPLPSWLVPEPFTDFDLGTLRSGKEAQIDVLERTGDDGSACLLARKRYLPRTVKHKGQLEALGVQRATAFRNDVQYREGRQFRKSRDRRAVEAMTSYGKHLLQDRWTGHEHDALHRLWHAGVRVPYPVSYAD